MTGQLARIDLNAAAATIVNAGHPPPLRLREGHVEAVSLPPDLPFGTARDTTYRVQQLSLGPGDRLVLLTDGMLDRNAAVVDIDKAVIGGAEMHSREAVQHLVGAVLHATDGELADDATVMCFDWHGGPPRHRTTDSGANR